MSDEDIDFSDIPEQGEEFFRRALLRLPDGRILIRAAIDRELADWLRSEGEEQDAIVNLALRELRERRRSA